MSNKMLLIHKLFSISQMIKNQRKREQEIKDEAIPLAKDLGYHLNWETGELTKLK